MRRFSKGFAFVPLLIVFFLLVVSAVTSYVVINQGTGGYSSRASGSPTCKFATCGQKIQTSKMTSTFCFTGGQSRVCKISTDSVNSYCKNRSEYVRSTGSTTGYYDCEVGAYCTNLFQCQSGLSCVNNKCAIPNKTVLTPTPTKVPINSNKCSSMTSEISCKFGNNCHWDLGAHPQRCVDKIVVGQKCFGAIPCVAGSSCVNNICKADAPPINATSCFVGAGYMCNQRTSLKCPDGIIDCQSGFTCKDSKGPVAGTTRTGTCAIDTSKCDAVGEGCCTASTGLRYCDSSKTGLACQSSTGKCIAFTGPSNTSCDEVGESCCIPTNGSRYCDAAKNVTCQTSTNKCVIKPTDPKPTATPDPGNGGGGGGGGGGNPPVTSVPPTVTPSAGTGTTGDVTLNFTLRLQGVTAQPKGGQTVPFKVKLKGPSTKDYVSGTLTANSVGKWTGSVAFTGISVGTDTKYTIYIKVGKHLQKRVCGFAPTETSGGLYNCTDSAIPLAAGANNLDFSGIMLLAGDLPSSTGEQNGVVDSYDISYILNNLGETDATKMAIGDLNFDGVIDTQDRSLIIQSLNVKYDDQ